MQVRGHTPLHDSCAVGHFEMSKYLLLKRAPVNAPCKARPVALLSLAAPLSLSSVSACAQRQIHLTPPHSEPYVIVQLGRTPLMFACASGNLELVSLLVEYGADVNYISQMVRTQPSPSPCHMRAPMLGSLKSPACCRPLLLITVTGDCVH